MTEGTENRSLIVRGRSDLTVPELALIKRGIALAEFLGKNEYICPILKTRFVLIPAGTFMMGSPENEKERNHNETQHKVTISKPFYMQRTPVTQGQWQRVMGNNLSSFKGDDNLPVENVSWNDVHEFIGRLNRQEGRDRYRLPREAEWEYACRAGSTTAYCFGDDPGGLAEYAWYYDNSNYAALPETHNNSEDITTHPVGEKKPNAWGLYDMHGNVWEWVKDGYEEYQSGSIIDPEGSPSGTWQLCVLRGGFWRRNARGCRSACRTVSGTGGEGNFGTGFRLVRTVEQDRYEPDRREPLEVEQSKTIKKQLTEEKREYVANVKEIIPIRDGDYIAYSNGTVLDTRTDLMWAGEDNGYGINWTDAESYCENYRRGGYSDWRMPTLDELEKLYESGIYDNVMQLIQITGCFVWASETRDSERRGSEAAGFYFNDGYLTWRDQSLDVFTY